MKKKSISRSSTNNLFSLIPLVCSTREKAPGQRECANGLEILNKQLRELDQVAMQAVGQELLPRKNNSLQGMNVDQRIDLIDTLTYLTHSYLTPTKQIVYYGNQTADKYTSVCITKHIHIMDKLHSVREQMIVFTTQKFVLVRNPILSYHSGSLTTRATRFFII